jgi:hypothetical protein
MEQKKKKSVIKEKKKQTNKVKPDSLANSISSLSESTSFKSEEMRSRMMRMMLLLMSRYDDVTE